MVPFFGLEGSLYMFYLYISCQLCICKNTGLDKQVFSKLEDDIVKSIMQMGDINAHINCNETDFIINHSDNVLDSFLPNFFIADSM
jgi:hypothetical protein